MKPARPLRLGPIEGRHFGRAAVATLALVTLTAAWATFSPTACEPVKEMAFTL